MKTAEAARASLKRVLDPCSGPDVQRRCRSPKRHDPVSQNGADFTARDITMALFKAKPGEPLDYSNHNLTYLDLSGLNFKGAKLAKSEPLRASTSRLPTCAAADMSRTRLDRAMLIRADFSGANLSGASILRPTIYTDLTENIADAPRFAGANLTGIRVMANMSGADFHGADLTGANFTPREGRPGQGTITTLAKNMLKSTDFTKAILRETNFDHAVLTFARFAGADLTGAKLDRHRSVACRFHRRRPDGRRPHRRRSRRRHAARRQRSRHGEGPVDGPQLRQDHPLVAHETKKPGREPWLSCVCVVARVRRWRPADRCWTTDASGGRP